ncbi:MAG: hypothetical protein ABFS24_15045 [Pseudomonadota bacterium]
MTCSNKPQSRLVAILVITGIVVLSGKPQLVYAEQFEPPSLEGFNLHVERDADGDGDEINETHIKQYLNQSGDSIVSMTTKDQLWAWSLNTRDNNSGIRNYVIRDSDCDGIFDEVYGLDDEYHVPDCLK